MLSLATVIRSAAPVKAETPAQMVSRGKEHYKDAVGRELTNQEHQVFTRALTFVTKNPGVISDSVELFQLVDTFIDRNSEMFEDGELPTSSASHNHLELIDSCGCATNGGRALAFSAYQYDGRVKELSDREDLNTFFQPRDPVVCMATAEIAMRVRRPTSLAYLETPTRMKRVTPRR